MKILGVGKKACQTAHLSKVWRLRQMIVEGYASMPNVVQVRAGLDFFLFAVDTGRAVHIIPL